MNPVSDKIPVQPNFNVDRYMGKWYEIARSTNIPLETGDYVYEAYSLDPAGKISVESEQVIEGKPHKIYQDAYFDKKLPSVWKVKFTNNLLTRMFSFDYKVVETDYSSYAIVYSKNRYMWFFTKEMAWILCRERIVDNDMLEELYRKLEEKTGMKKEDMRETLQ